MTIKWSQFPSAVDLTASDILVGLSGGTTNARFNGSSLLLKAQNLADVANKTTSFNNLSPLTTKGDLIWQNGTANVRLPIGALNQVLSVGASNTLTWVDNPAVSCLLIANNLSDLSSVSDALTNLGLSTTDDVEFNSIISTEKVTASEFTSTTGNNLVSYANAIIAHAGGGQGSATQLTKQINRVTTVTDDNDSVKLPSAIVGLIITVINSTPLNVLDCYPSSGQIIDPLSADTALEINPNETVMFFCAVSGIWNTIVTA